MSDYNFITSSGEKIPIIITVRRGIRNITLRPYAGEIRRIDISRPWIASNASAMKFVEQKRRWLERFFINAPIKKHLKSGDCFEFLGKKILIIYDEKIRANRFIQDDNGNSTLFVGGDSKMIENRVRMFVKSELLNKIKEIIHTTPRDLWPRRICLRDTTSRWGSRSTTGTISFSWRLGLAPYEVMRYVVMHELAHVRHMNHSPEFWATVRELYGFGTERARRWLNTNGAHLHEIL